MSDLRERVARAMYEAEGGTKWDVLENSNKTDYRNVATAAIAIVLDEAAKVVDDELASMPTATTDLYEAGYNIACREIAAAIRALASPSAS